MTRRLILNENGLSLSEIFSQYLSDIQLEVEAVKLRNMRSNIEGVNEHLDRIDNALKGIMDTKLALVEKLLYSQTMN